MTLSITSDSTLTARYERIPDPSPPSTPSVGGPSSGYISQSYQYSAVSTDINGDNIRYTFNWGDGTSTTTGWYSSGATVYASHSWSSTGQYSVQVTAEDSTYRSSSQSSPLTVTISNQPAPPSTPSVGGPSSGYVGSSYQFSAVSTDANGDNIRYTFDWGDGTSTTTGYYSSGSTAYASHSWPSACQYSVRVTAQDSTGRSSGSSSPKTVTIQNQQTYYSLTVTASDGGGYTLCPAVYVDGNLVGYAPPTVQVAVGSHTVYVDTPYIYWNFYFFSDGLGNGASRQITGDTDLHAWYSL